MTGKRPPRYLLQRDYGYGYVTIREYVQRNAALIEFHRLQTFGNARTLRLFDTRLRQEIGA